MNRKDIVPYFTYGSNMSTHRLRERIPEAQLIGVGLLENYEFKCNKRSLDGSSKGNIIPKGDNATWGVMFEIPKTALADLDGHECGYRRITVSVFDGKNRMACETYISEHFTEDLPYDWYLAYILEGAREHHPPEEYIQKLSEIPVKEDQRKKGK